MNMKRKSSSRIRAQVAHRPSQAPPRASAPPPFVDPAAELAAIASQLSPHGIAALLAHARKLREDERIRGARPPLLLLSPREFAARIQQAIQELPQGPATGRMLVAALYRALEDRGETSGLALGEFKDRLLTAHRAGLLDLCRAEPTDRVEASILAASEIRHLGITYHLVRRDRELGAM